MKNVENGQNEVLFNLEHFLVDIDSLKSKFERVDWRDITALVDRKNEE